MAKRNSTSGSSGVAAKRASAKPLRASQREGLAIDCSARALRDLMTEQSKLGEKWATYYEGSRSDFAAAGFPDDVFPDGPSREIRINGQVANLARKGAVYELEIIWHERSPYYHGANHPALSELARMMSVDASWWLGFVSDDEIPVHRMAECERASDYRLPASKRFKLARGEKAAMFRYFDLLRHYINNAEILPMAPAAATPPAHRGNVLPISAASRLRAARKAAD